MKKLSSIKFYGMELPIYIFFAAVIVVAAYLEIIPNQLIGAIAVMFTLGIFFGELGDRIPIWNTYCGGGAILAFLACGLLTYFEKIPQNVIDITAGWMNGYSFLNLFIAFLVVGSLLGIDRKLLIKSSTLFLPTIVAGLIGASLLGILGGLLAGKNPMEIMTAYVLPIMGGGAGAGAIPMAKVYADVTGTDSSGYLSFAIAILAVGNIVSIIFAVILNTIGIWVPKWSGNGELVKRQEKEKVKEEESKVVITMDDVCELPLILRLREK